MFLNLPAVSKWPIVSFVLLMFLVGCSGFKYAEKVDPARLDQKVQKKSSRVHAQANDWRNSGVIVQRNASYQISARGRWRAGILCGWTSPSGVETHRSSCPPVNNVVRKWSAGALIGKIGENGEPFGVGYEYLFTPKEEGTLYEKNITGTGVHTQAVGIGAEWKSETTMVDIFFKNNVVYDIKSRTSSKTKVHY
jgi:hypothetical protein